jgi:hypothetical protein
MPITCPSVRVACGEDDATAWATEPTVGVGCGCRLGSICEEVVLDLAGNAGATASSATAESPCACAARVLGTQVSLAGASALWAVLQNKRVVVIGYGEPCFSACWIG